MQLRMTVPASRVSELPEVALPDGYVLRAGRDGDVQGWVKLLHSAGFTQWDGQRVQKYLEDPERKEGSRIVAWGATIVSATFASRATLETPRGRVEVGVLDFVSSDPEHRRKGLSRAVCTSVIKFLFAASYPEVILDTDDWRLPAIALYLSLGFEPMMMREDMLSRWDTVMKQLEAGGTSDA